jgi:hypothetical protein
VTFDDGFHGAAAFMHQLEALGERLIMYFTVMAGQSRDLRNSELTPVFPESTFCHHSMKTL